MTAADLKRIRADLGMSLADLAEALGYSDRQSLARMERGTKPITPRAELAVLRLLSERRLNRRVKRA